MTGLHRRNPSRDENEPEIVKALRKMGVSVQPISIKGVPDLVWGWRGAMGFLEVKGPLGPRGGAKGRTLTEDQLKFRRHWAGPTILIVRSVDEAINAVQAEVRRQRGDA